MDVGSVYATLGGRFSPAGFNAFGSAMYKARADMETSEKRISQASERASKSLHAMGHAAKIGAVGGIAGLGVVIGYSIKKAADFEAQLSSLGSVSNASGRQMGLLKKQAMDAGAATKYSALQAAQAQTELAKGGLSVSRILGGALQGALALAAAGELDLADAAKYTVNAMKLFKLNGDQATHVADALATAANSTTADVQDFGMALTQGGGAAKSAGYNFNETVTILEALAEVGVKNSDAGTSMKTALLQLVGPTKKQAEAAKQAGLSFLDQHGQMKSITAISEMLRAKTGDMTKAQRTALLQTLAGTDGFRTLLALYDAGPAKLTALEKGLEKQGTAAKVAAEKQDNFKGKLENFKGSVETAAIAVGGKLLPGLTDLATKGTEAMNRLVTDGSADRFAQGVVSGAHEAGQVLGDLGHTAGDVAGVLLDVGRALDLGDASHIEAILAAIAGFKIAGVVAPMVVALGGAISTLVLNARTAPTLAAFFASLGANPYTAVALGVGALAAGLVILGSRESADTKLANENAAAHRRQADAIKAVQDAERGAADKGLAAKQSTLDLKRAQEELSVARDKYGKKSPEYRQALLNEQEAQLRNTTAHNAYNTSLEHQNTVNKKRIQDAKDRVAQTDREAAAARREVEASSRPIKTAGGKTISRAPRVGDVEAAAVAQQRQTEAVQAYIQAVARANVSDVSRQRLMNAASQITEKNSQGVAQLVSAMAGLPTKKQTSILLSGDQNVLATLGTLAGQLTALGRRRTVAKVLANADSASAAVLAFQAILAGVPLKKVARVLAETRGKSELEALKRLIDSTNGKNVAIDVTTRYKQIGVPAPGSQGGGATRRAAGRGPGNTERALVGEGRGPEWYVDPATGKVMRVVGPQLMDLPASAYVIPTESAYRGRALGLMAEMARDMGIAGYKGGRGAKAAAKKKGGTKPAPAAKAPRALPGDVQPTTLPLASLETKEQDARTELNKTKAKVHDLPGKIRADEKRVKDTQGRQAKSAATKAKKARDLKAARDQLAEHRKSLKDNKAAEARQRKAWQQLRDDLAQAKRYQAEITKQEQLANTAANEMRLADGKDDQGGYDTAKGKRGTALKALRDLLARARAALKDQDSEAARELDTKITGTDVDIQDTETGETQQQTDAEKKAEQDAQDAADRLATTGMTDAERAQLKGIDKAIALAALTKTLTDDTDEAGKKVSFLEQILGVAQGRGVDDSVITDIAGQVKQARDNLESLTGGGTNSNPDLQAQLDQERARRHVSDENARINAQALSVFAGGGDIGTGGPNARAAAGGSPNITFQFQSYVPPSPQEARRLADYTVGGLGYQGGRQSPREPVA